jgi:demethylsterigmatocystin 6-O-methyltransferase
MTAVQSNEWLEGLDVLDQSVGSAAPPSGPESEVPFFVDIGGGHGHQCIQLLQKHPRLKNRIVLQDLPEAIDRLPAPLPQGIRAIPHDFFTPQPAATRGATFFYLRRILHDWPDEDCLRILKHVRDAMSSAPGKSKILIDEVVLPDVDAPWQAVMQDVSMGILFGGKERTRAQWDGLVAKAGLKISEVKIYSVGSCAGVVVLDKA